MTLLSKELLSKNMTEIRNGYLTLPPVVMSRWINPNLKIVWQLLMCLTRVFQPSLGVKMTG